MSVSHGSVATATWRGLRSAVEKWNLARLPKQQERERRGQDEMEKEGKKEDGRERKMVRVRGGTAQGFTPL